MAGNRWKNLDFEPRRVRGGKTAKQVDSVTGQRGDPNGRGNGRAPERSKSRPEVTPAERPNADLPLEVAHAIGAYLLRNYQAVVDLLEPRLESEPELPGGQRTLALALARLNREAEATERLRAAVQHSPSDWLARASLSSLLLRGGDEPIRSSGHQVIRSSAAEAAEHLCDALAVSPGPALRELLGAACWRIGQEALRAGEYREAVGTFAGAAAEFLGAAEGSGAARQALPVRQSSAYVGQAVALLLADEPEAAQTLFARSPIRGAAAGDPLGRFAAGLYELCDELARAPASERLAAAATLREVVLSVRLEVGFYDGRQAVSLAWAGGPS